MTLSLGIIINVTVVAGLAAFAMRSSNHILATVLLVVFRLLFSVTAGGFTFSGVVIEIAIFGLFGFYVFKIISLDPENVTKAIVACILGLLIFPAVLLATITSLLVAVLT